MTAEPEPETLKIELIIEGCRYGCDNLLTDTKNAAHLIVKYLEHPFELDISEGIY